MRTLKVGTLNVWNKSGPWLERRELIRREIARLVPDVLGLQELLRLLPSQMGQKEERGMLAARAAASPEGVPLETDGRPEAESPWSAQNDQLSELVDGVDLPNGVTYRRCYFEARAYGGGLVLGNGLLSRHPILEARGFALPGEESGETRSLLYALLDTPDGKLPVFVTHLNWKFHHGSVRVRQVRFIVERIDELVPEGDASAEVLPTVLLGDFNAEPDSDEIRFLRGLHTLEGRSVHFADSWRWAGGGGPGFTFDRGNGFALRSNEPPRRIDYVFVRGPDPALRCEPLKAELAFTAPGLAASGETVWPSDHYGVIAELAAEPRAT